MAKNVRGSLQFLSNLKKWLMMAKNKDYPLMFLEKTSRLRKAVPFKFSPFWSVFKNAESGEKRRKS
jgi:hypothetical protein